MTDNKTRKAAANYVLLMRRDDDGTDELVETFIPSAEAKVPKRAVGAFLESVAEDREHELYEDLVNGRLFIVSGHPEPVAYTERPKLSIG